MTRLVDLLVTALAPAIWGSTYIVTTQWLPPGHPLTIALLRALPVGLLLLMAARELPPVSWVPQIACLGALNFTIFWSLLFVSAYRLPGGVAATVGAVQPLIVVFFARIALGSPVRTVAIAAALLGAAGVALLIVTPAAALDPVGLAAGLGAAVSMAAGNVLSRKWQPPLSVLGFTAWQLTAGGVLLLPMALLLEPPLPALTWRHVAGIGYLGVVGAALTYLLWMRGVKRLQPSTLATLSLLSPVSAVVLGWVVLDQQLTPIQLCGGGLVLAAIGLGNSPGVVRKPRHG